MKTTLRIPLDQYAYLEVESENETIESAIDAYLESVKIFKDKKLRQVGASVAADHEKVKKEFLNGNS